MRAAAIPARSQTRRKGPPADAGPTRECRRSAGIGPSPSRPAAGAAGEAAAWLGNPDVGPAHFPGRRAGRRPDSGRGADFFAAFPLPWADAGRAGAAGWWTGREPAETAPPARGREGATEALGCAPFCPFAGLPLSDDRDLPATGRREASAARGREPPTSTAGRAVPPRAARAGRPDSGTGVRAAEGRDCGRDRCPGERGDGRSPSAGTGRSPAGSSWGTGVEDGSAATGAPSPEAGVGGEEGGEGAGAGWDEEGTGATCGGDGAVCVGRAGTAWLDGGLVVPSGGAGAGAGGLGERSGGALPTRRWGRRESGSTYPWGSEVTRTPRCT